LARFDKFGFPPPKTKFLFQFGSRKLLINGESNMSINTKMQQFGKSVLEITQQGVNFVLGGFKKIFSPTVDEYPSVGIQPFEGDAAKEKS
jgi:hypothetical protein